MKNKWRLGNLDRFGSPRNERMLKINKANIKDRWGSSIIINNSKIIIKVMREINFIVYYLNKLI